MGVLTMPLIPVSQLPDKPSAKSSNLIPVDQLPDAPTGDSGGLGYDSHGNMITGANGNTDNSQLSGIPAVGVEVARGLEHGTGQMVADAGFLANAGGVLKNPVGSAVQQFGKDLMDKSASMPETNLGGFTKGAANFAGEAAPMLATFGAGEAMRFEKLGEAGVKMMSAASKSPRVAAFMSHLVRPMGQATLFGLTNMINTASTLPETMEFNQKAREIMESGKSGAIAGVTITPIMDGFSSILSKHGSSAAKAFMTAMTGSPKAAEDALNLARTQGSYDSIVVDPSKPFDQRISFKTRMAKELSPAEREIIHKGILDQQEAEISGIREAHQQAQRTLQDQIAEQNHQFGLAEAQVKNDVDNSFRLKKEARDSAIEANIAKIGQQNGAKLDALEMANTQSLNQKASAFDKQIEQNINLLNANKSMLYANVLKSDPAGGFQVDGIIGRIKALLKSSYGVDLVKEADGRALGGGMRIEDFSPTQRASLEAQLPKTWTIKVKNNTSGIMPPDLVKVSKFLTGDNGYLANLERLKQTNGGKVSLEMLMEDSGLLKKMAYAPETGVTDSGLAALDATIRPNKLVGDLGKDNDPGHWVGSQASLASLKEAAIHDSAISSMLDSAKAIRSEFIGNKEFTANMTPKVKALLQNKEGYAALRQFEGSLGQNSVRLTDAFRDYAKTSESIASSRRRLSEGLSNAISNQKSRVAMELNAIKNGELGEGVNRRYANKEALIKLKREAADAKAADLEKAQEFQKTLKEKLSIENKAREQALNEVSMLGSYNTALGKFQRGTMYTGIGGAIYGSPRTPVALALFMALTPRTSISGMRAIKSFMQSNSGRVVSESLERLATSDTSKRLLLGSLLNSRRREQRA